jgi:hypothetical protein
MERNGQTDKNKDQQVEKCEWTKDTFRETNIVIGR